MTEVEYPVPDELALMVAAARQIAVLAHMGQTDKAGRDYFRTHVLDVVTRVGHDPVLRTIAYLHDTVEDGVLVTLDSLIWSGFPTQVVAAVDAITRRDGERPDDYYARVKANPLALKVKVQGDIPSNTDPARMRLLDWPTRARLDRKYAHALEVLTEWRVCQLPDCGCDGTWHA